MASGGVKGTQPAPAKAPAKTQPGKSKSEAANGAPAKQKGVTTPDDEMPAGDEEEDDLQDFLNSLK
jgi:hypothetical protein